MNMSTLVLMYVKLRARFVFCLAVLATCAASPAFAQSNGVTFAVTPANAAPGVPRQITASFIWPDFCERNGATVVANDSRTHTLTIRVDGHLNSSVLYFCDTLSTYSPSVTFTPDLEGDLRILLVTNDGQYLGESVLHTRAANSNRATVDLTGMWYDPATLGSGLTFVHSFGKSDQVFGTWYVYDTAGVPRWYSLQNLFWSAGGTVAQGLIYETRADSVACAPPFLACPITFASIVSPSTVRVTVQGPNSAQVQALSANGTPLFSSNIVRSIF